MSFVELIHRTRLTDNPHCRFLSSSEIKTSRLQQDQSNIMNTPRATSLYLPPRYYNTQSEVNLYPPNADQPPSRSQIARSLSPEDVQKMKYKIALG